MFAWLAAPLLGGETPWGPLVADGSTLTRSASVFTILWHYIVLIVAFTVAGLAAGLLIAHYQPTSYSAESRVFLSSQASFDALADGQYASDPSRYLDQQAAIMTSSPLLQRAIELGAESVDKAELKASLAVIASAESDVLTVRATALASEQAGARVDDIITAYREYQKSLVITQLNSIELVSSTDEKRIAQQRAAVYGDGVALVEKAFVTKASSAIRNASVLAVAGLLLSSGLAFAMNGHRKVGGPVSRGGPHSTSAGAISDWPDTSASDGSKTAARTPAEDGEDDAATAGHDGSPVGAASTRAGL
jgi:capsular polysaccharide biosynthesis protein